MIHPCCFAKFLNTGYHIYRQGSPKLKNFAVHFKPPAPIQTPYAVHAPPTPNTSHR